jgi:hypothetical protein
MPEKSFNAHTYTTGEAVVLGPERALGARQAGDPAVEPVEHHRDEDRHRSLLETAAHRLHDRVEAREERDRREKVGQPVDPAPGKARLDEELVLARVLHQGSIASRLAVA